MTTMACNYSVNMKEVGIRIKRLREEKAISKKRMQHFFGISPQALYKWERGDSIPEIQNLVALSRLLDVSVDYLLLGDNYPLSA